MSVFNSLREEGSITIEASLLLTAATLVIGGMVSLFVLIQMQIQIQQALERTGNQLVAENKRYSQEEIKELFCENLKQTGHMERLVKDGMSGFFFTDSEITGDCADLVVRYEAVISPVWPPGSFLVLQRSRKRYFTGYKGDAFETEQYVYITRNGKVYHVDRQCTYLTPVISKTRIGQTGALRNGNGAKYYPCGNCIEAEKTQIVYYTSWGTLYHGSENCRYLSHPIMHVKMSDINERMPCSKCGRRE